MNIKKFIRHINIRIERKYRIAKHNFLVKRGKRAPAVTLNIQKGDHKHNAYNRYYRRRRK